MADWSHAQPAAAAAPETPLPRARRLRADGQYPDAIAAYEKYLAGKPEDVDVRIELAQANAWARNDKRAIEIYDQVLAKYPKNKGIKSRANMALVRLYQEQGRAHELNIEK